MVVLGGLGSITGATFAAILLQVMDAALRSVNGVFSVGVSLLILAAALSYPVHRSGLNSPRGWLLWLRGPGLMAVALLALYAFGRSWIESNDTPGKAEDWLRYVIYALILIVLMLLRPQGLFGRSELSWSLFRRRDRTPPNDSPTKIVDEPREEGVAGTLV
jgi:branched-chain amino acid transport system permease protein